MGAILGEESICPLGVPVWYLLFLPGVDKEPDEGLTGQEQDRRTMVHWTEVLAH